MHSLHDQPHPVIFVLDQSPVVPKVLMLMLKRHAGLLTTIVAFTNPNLAARWLTGAMDEQKAASYPLGSPWDHYPPLTPIAMAIIDTEFAQVRSLRVLDWVCALLPPATPLVTTSSQQIDEEEHSWSLSVAHLPKPLEREDVVARLSPLLTSAMSTRVVPVVSNPPQTRTVHRPVRLQSPRSSLCCDQ